MIVATPGRLLDHMRARYAALGGIEMLVIDEADRMLDMGFLPDVRRILGQLPARRQTMLFSATMPTPIQALAREMLRNPVTIALGRPTTPAVSITQAAYPVPAELKSALLVELLRCGEIKSVIAFTRTKHRANRLADYLTKNGVAAGRIHGNRSQTQRTQALGGFKAGKFPVLVATDIAARGIDVDALSHVVNFDVPASPEDYVHRVGRTARAEAKGDALLFVSPEEEADVQRHRARDRAPAAAADAPRLRLHSAAGREARGAASAATRPDARRAGRRPSPGSHKSRRTRADRERSAQPAWADRRNPPGRLRDVRMPR